jgi:hypothetical protein
MRFSSSKPGAFALAVTTSPGQVSHVIITSSNNGFTLMEEVKLNSNFAQSTLIESLLITLQSVERNFFCLEDVIKYYTSLGVLTTPFESTLPEQE